MAAASHCRHSPSGGSDEGDEEEDASLPPTEQLDGDEAEPPRRGRLYDNLPCTGVFGEHNDSVCIQLPTLITVLMLFDR